MMESMEELTLDDGWREKNGTGFMAWYKRRFRGLFSICRPLYIDEIVVV